jgi:hypothetical protein
VYLNNKAIPQVQKLRYLGGVVLAEWIKFMYECIFI